MTPKEKAKELIDSFCLAGVESDCYVSEIMAKKCALIACKHIMYHLDWNYRENKKDKFWDYVIEEISKL